MPPPSLHATQAQSHQENYKGPIAFSVCIFPSTSSHQPAMETTPPQATPCSMPKARATMKKETPNPKEKGEGKGDQGEKRGKEPQP
ncbi:hypothetical protein BDY21DRAFT_72556 [Lineolata rhizophorae]|uniref:Uncharacterized protein n=1 Tax=Lineolata rhizophorae TaxID=578093 RepID=A0A6A6NU27_9PEZI|nr:hypothetical protein BDY21DRAFT_72556 [Lineolata rhizophorae]